MTYKIVCDKCNGTGKIKQRNRVKSPDHTTDLHSKSLTNAAYKNCVKCLGTGLILSLNNLEPKTDEFPHVAIIGAGIGGTALAVACLHRGIPFTIFERDCDFNSRAQGYGLTLQQASKTVKNFGIHHLKEGIVSTKHIVHNPEGEVIAQWGMRKWLGDKTNQKSASKTNIHIARQQLRKALLNELGSVDMIQWRHKLLDFSKTNRDKIHLTFDVNGIKKTVQTDLLVGADGIRSVVRNFMIPDDKLPLKYLNCMVILGICPLNKIQTNKRELLDNATVFQTADGVSRIYCMPYDNDNIMWQFSFLTTESTAKTLNLNGSIALKKEVLKRANWHDPIPAIIEATSLNKITGYPVYDRFPITPEFLDHQEAITLIGDAAHPMSPFKGQGANQALLDALDLAQLIYENKNSRSNWKKNGIKQTLLTPYESKMISRTTPKVLDSAMAVEVLHSPNVLSKCDQPRGSIVKKK